jgi:hypothetical protein
MGSLVKLIRVLALAHLLAVIGFAGWLVASDRVDAERLKRVREMFQPTIAEEKALLAEAESEAAAATAAAEERRRLLEVPMTRTEQIISAERFEQRAELALRGLEDERRRLLSDLSGREREVTQREEALAKRQTDWEESIATEKERQTDEQFRKAVRLLEAAPSKQSKDWILELVQTGREDQAVTYLNAMNPAKSAGLLKAFKGEGEAKVATDVLERLRQLGLESESSAGAPNAAESADRPAEPARQAPAPGAR